MAQQCFEFMCVHKRLVLNLYAYINARFFTLVEIVMFYLVTFLTPKDSLHPLDFVSCPILSKFHHNFLDVFPHPTSPAHRWSKDKAQETGGRLDATRQIGKNTTTATTTPRKVQVATLHSLYQTLPTDLTTSTHGTKLWNFLRKGKCRWFNELPPWQDLFCQKFWDALAILSHH